MKWVYWAVVLFLSGCATHPLSTTNQVVADDSIKKYTNNESGIGLIITNQALKAYNEEYQVAKKHKAFAQSLSGSWGWVGDRTSVEHAKTSALVRCQKENLKSEKLYPCEIINVNGTWSK